jgi:hypothetical protein
MIVGYGLDLLVIDPDGWKRDSGAVPKVYFPDHFAVSGGVLISVRPDTCLN